MDTLPRIMERAARCHAERRLDEAAGLYRKAIDVDPDDPLIRYNLGTALFAKGDLEAALRVLEDALIRAPDDARLHYGLGCVYQAAERLGQSLHSFARAVELQPENPDARYGLGCVHHSQGDFEPALECFERVLRNQPDHPAAAHMIAAIRGESPVAPPGTFVRRLFDSYADQYDAHLCGMLQYCAPELVHDALLSALSDRCALRILDLGCGTGLFGEQIRPLASHLVGLDVSPEMLRNANERGCYDLLLEEELAGFLSRAAAGDFDVVSAVDVFSYLGALDGIFRNVRRILRPKGLFAFTVEAGEADFGLTDTGRYRHSQAYLDRIVRGAGFTVRSFQSGTIRSEQRRPCEGFVVVLGG